MTVSETTLAPVQELNSGFETAHCPYFNRRLLLLDIVVKVREGMMINYCSMLCSRWRTQDHSLGCKRLPRLVPAPARLLTSPTSWLSTCGPRSS